MTEPPLKFPDLEPALEQRDADQVVALFAGRSEPARRAVAADVWRWCTDGQRGQLGQMAFLERRAVATPAALACATKTELRKLPRPWLAWNEATFQVLVDRKPDWLGPWMETLLQQQTLVWGFCHRLVRAGACPKPMTDGYIVAMYAHTIYEGGRARSPQQVVAEDPSLLEDEIWRFFEVEAPRNSSLTTRGEAWAVLFLKLSEQGVIPRDRLLDATLDALTRDFSAYAARWFQDLHRRLDPSLDEHEARLDRYLHLLGSQVPPTVRLALEALEALAAHGRLPAGPYADAAAFAVASGPKVTAFAALELLERVVESGPSAPASGASCAIAALGHPSVDVQRRSLDLLVRLVDPNDLDSKAAMLAAGDGVAPALRGRLEALVGIELPGAALGGNEAQQDDEQALRERAGALRPELGRLAGVDEALTSLASGGRPPPLSFLRHQIPVIHPGNAIRPIQDVAELVELLTGLVESVTSCDEVERALDGISRLCDQDLGGVVVAPLRKRAVALLNSGSSNRPVPFLWGDPRGDICGVVTAWLTGQMPPDVYGQTSGPAGFLSRRAHEVAVRATGRRAQPLLAAPTHRGGWVDPAALVGRAAWLEARGLEAAIEDAHQAILRLAPIDPATLSPALDSLPSHLVEQATFPPRVRSLIDEHYPGDPPPPPPMTVEAWLWYQPWDHWMLSPASIRWVALVCPWAIESLLEVGARATTSFLDLSPAPDAAAFVEVLVDPDVPIGPSGVHLLGVALAAKDVRGRSLAIDAFIAAAEDGRLDTAKLARRLEDLLDRDIVNAARLASALSEAARASLVHADAVHAVLELLFVGDPDRPPHQLHHLLQLALDLSLELGRDISSFNARAYLGQLRARSPASKQGRLAKDLLALVPPAEPHRCGRAIAIATLRSRIERAERWSAQSAPTG